VRAIFEKQPFGKLERLVTQRLLDVLQSVARQELANDYWLRMVADLGGRSLEEMRVIVLEFLDTDVFHLSREHWAAPEHQKRFEFVEPEADQLFIEEPGLTACLENASLSGTATAEEIGLLKRLRFKGKRPAALYFYRELQNLRDPLHCRVP